MEKTIWNEDALGGASITSEINRPDTNGTDTARGLLIGLAISQVFWVALAYFVF